MQVRRMLVACAGLCLLGTSLFADSTSDNGKYSRWPKIRLAGFAVGGGYAHFGGSPFGYPGFGYPYFGGFDYAPFGFGPFGYDAWLTPPAAYYQATLGELKVSTPDKNASVFLDGGFAGNVGSLKTMWIEPGTHDLRITDGNRSFEERIYVLTGKTLRLRPELEAMEGNGKK